MSPALANFFFQAVNFLLLAGLLGWFVFRPIRRTITAEQEKHERQEEEIRSRHSEAESLVQEAKVARQAADRELAEKRKAALEGVESERRRLLAEGAEALHAERQRFEDETRRRRSEEVAAVAEQVGLVAASSLRRFLVAIDGPSLDLALVREAARELEALPREARAGAVVESARPLGEEAEGILAPLLGEGYPRRVVAELGAGVRILTRAGAVDATASSLARQAAREVRDLGEALPHGGDASHG